MARPPSDSRPIPPADAAVVSIVDDQIFSLRLSGIMSEALSRQTLDRTREVLRGRRVKVGVADTIGVTEIEVGVQGPVREFVALTRAHGVTEVFCAATSPAMRLFGSALALATGVKIHFFATADAAWTSARIAAKRE